MSHDAPASPALLPFVAEATGAVKAVHAGRIQSLWGGYGELFRVSLTGAATPSAVVKWARPPARRRDAADASHARKCRSYDVETAFYERYAPRCDDSCRVARLLGRRAGEGEWVIVLEDLDAAGFAGRSRDPRGAELIRCLGWLASFHARFLGARADGLWETGAYWHLATRQEELAAMRDGALRARAPELDRQLRAAHHQTLVHGDAKPANFCFGPAAVAAVDFQYVGGGPGIVDVAYLLHGSTPKVAEESLDAYFAELRRRLPEGAPVAEIEREWRALYPVAVMDFERFLAGWHRA